MTNHRTAPSISTQAEESARDVLVAARDLIVKRENWTQGAYARDRLGDRTNSEGGEAVCWCAVGAIRRAIRLAGVHWCEGGSDIYLTARGALRRQMYDLDVAVFNDRSEHADVLDAFDRAIAAASARMNEAASAPVSEPKASG